MNIDRYPYYLHTDEEFIEYWKDYFVQYPSTDKSVGIYIDFPFCKSICKFCAFHPHHCIDNKELVENYLNALIESLRKFTKEFSQGCNRIHHIDNIYFGGGSPSLIPSDYLQEIIKIIIPLRACMWTMEVHPGDLSDKLLHDFDLFLFDVVSIGVQSFDKTSCANQNRYHITPEELGMYINDIHEIGLYVNVDMIALLDDTGQHGWNVFRKDLYTLADLHPDDICLCVNFNNDNYYIESLRLRAIIIKFLEVHPEYIPEHPEFLSLDMTDVINYGEEVYHLRTKEYTDYYKLMKPTVLTNDPEITKNNVVIGFGGNMSHCAISSAGEKMETIDSAYREKHNRFIRTVHETKPPVKYDGSFIPFIKIGQTTIKGGTPMANMALVKYYARLIQREAISIESIPEEERAAVVEQLAMLPPIKRDEETESLVN